MKLACIVFTALVLFTTGGQAHARHCAQHRCWVGPGLYDPYSLMNSRINYTGPYNLDSIPPPYYGPRPGLVSCPGPYCPGPFGWW